MQRMEFPEAGRVNAKRFLEYFLAKHTYPVSLDESLPVQPNWPSIYEEEVEAECMDICRTLLSKSSCPGMLNYNITRAVTSRIVVDAVELYCLTPKEDEEATGDDNTKPSHPKLVDGKQLTLAIVQMVHKVCQEWLQDLPPLICCRGRPEFALSTLKNGRRKMEDRHSVCVDVNTLYDFKDFAVDQSIFSVFDGHVGIEAASYSSVHAHHNIIRHPAFLSDPILAFKDGIRTTDERVCARGIKSGSTAVLALLRGQKLYIGWIGDSEAVLFRQGKAVDVMQPHKPDREDEQARIEEAGGMVIFMGAWRVNGILSVSRAIGDAKEKKYIIGEADVAEIDLDGSEDFLVVACDGIWDVVNGSELIECVEKHFRNGGSKNDTAKAIVEFARDEGSQDNLTAIVVFFQNYKPPSPDPKPSVNTEEATGEQ